MERLNLVMIKLIKAQKNLVDMEFIFKIRNDPNLRKFSYNKKKISEKDHKNWFYKNENKYIFIIRYGNKSIGYIRANDKNKPYLSWAIMPKFRGNDLGSISLKMFLKKIEFKTCFALVDERNIPSLIMVIKNNFKFKLKNKRFILFQFKR